jgi:ribosomal protein S18 acetylase RimI-like enzyme
MRIEDRKSITVTPVTRENAPAVSAAVARAFEDDPVYEWIFPEFEGRLARMIAMNEALLPRLLPVGFIEMNTTSESAGVSIWIGPEKWEPPTKKLLTAVPKLVRIMGVRAVSKLVGAMGMMKKEHPKDQPHWYLSGLATDTAYQRTGVGTALITPKLEECDRAGLGAYLETQKAINVPYYERFGFRVTKEVDLPKGGPHLWLMWRDPQ